MQALKVPQDKPEVTVPLKSNEAELNASWAAMCEAGKDEMFMAELEEAMDDFHHVDTEGPRELK